MSITITKPKFFKYQLKQELPVEDLYTRFANHGRLSVFAQKGCSCVTCGAKGTKLIMGIDSGGGKHWDLYTDDLTPITVDHIIPKSLGGENCMSNYQPMCFPCNNKKGNGIDVNIARGKVPYDKSDFVKLTKDNAENYIGKDLWKIVGTKNPRHLGVFEDVRVNIHTNQSAAMVSKEYKNSFYDLGKSLYVRIK
jgi:hypothetical protein